MLSIGDQYLEMRGIEDFDSKALIAEAMKERGGRGDGKCLMLERGRSGMNR